MKKYIYHSLVLLCICILGLFCGQSACAQSYNAQNIATGGLYTALTKDADGNIYVIRAVSPNDANYQLVKYTNGQGQPTVLYSGLTQEPGSYPWGLAVAANGQIFVSTSMGGNGNKILKLTNSNGTYTVSDFQNDPDKYYTGLAIDANDQLHVLQYNGTSYEVVRYNNLNNNSSYIPLFSGIPSEGGLSYATNLAIAANGDVYYTDPFCVDESNTALLSMKGGVVKVANNNGSYDYATKTYLSKDTYASALSIEGNDLYALESTGTAGGYKLSKYSNMSGTGSTLRADLKVGSFIYPWGIVFKGDIGYYTTGDDGISGGSVMRIVPNPNAGNEPSNEIIGPVSSDICANASANFSLTTTGATAHQWEVSTNGGNTYYNVLDNANYSGATTANLSIINIPASFNTYIYRCKVAFGAAGSKYSSTANLFVTGQVQIDAHPINTQITTGGSGSMSVAASGGTSYQWQQKIGGGSFVNISDGGNFFGANSATLQISNATSVLNNNQFQCIVSNACFPSETSNAVTLTVNAAPSISQQPGDKTVMAGDQIAFTMLAAGATGYQWQVSTGAGFTDVSNGALYSGVTSNTLTITAPTIDMNGYLYRCIVTGAASPDATSLSAKLTVTVPPNQQPVIGNLNGDAVGFTEGSSAVLIDVGNNTTVTDSDSPDFNGGNVTVSITANRISAEDVLSIRNEGTAAGQIEVSGSNVTYGGVTIGTWAGGTGTNNLVISFNGNSSLASAQALIRNLTYTNTNATDPSTAARTIAVTVNDGDGGTSVPALVTVNVIAVNDAPIMTATALNPTYTEGGAAVSLFSGTSISTVEAGQLIQQLRLTVSGVQNGGMEELLVDGTSITLSNGTVVTTATNAISVNVSIAGTTADVILSKAGGISASVWNTITNGIAYHNISQNPTGESRTVTITSIQDNGGTADGGVDMTALSIASTVTVVAVNNAPVVTTSGGTTNFTESVTGPPVPVVIDGGITLSDADNTTLASATVAITGNFQSTQDMLSFANDGATMGNITAALYNNATGELTLSSAGSSATLAQWQAALRAVSYANTSRNPSTATRTISFAVNDGSRGSVAATKTVSVAPVNDAPVAVDDYVTLLEDVPVVGNVLTNDSDPEGNALTASLVIAPVNGTVILNADGSFTYTPHANYAGRDSLQYQVCDNGVPSMCDTAWLHLTINPVNDAPSITYTASRIVQEDETTALAGITFSDVDAGTGTVTVTLSVPSGLLEATTASGVTVGGTSSSLILNGSINEINAFIVAGAIKYIPVSNATGDVPLTIAINDNGNTGIGTYLPVQVTQILKILAVNDAPVNSVPVAQSVDQDATLVFNSANSNLISISDVDAGGAVVEVSLTATNGVMTLGSTTGLSFSVGSGTSDATMTFTGTIADINTALNGLVFEPTPGYNGPAFLQIITDDKGNSGSGGAKTDTDNIAITVNSVSPKVISVNASTANGTYKIDDVIALTITFDQTVVVNTGGGRATLLLETGTIDREAIYASGSGSNTLTFNYTIQAEDVSNDLDYRSIGALSLNGSTIENAHGKNAILTLPTVGGPNSIAGQNNIVVDGVIPTVTSVAVPADKYYRVTEDLDFTVNFSEPTNVSTTGGTPSLAITVGAQNVIANYISGSGTSVLTFRYTVGTGLEAHNGITIGALTLNGGTIRDIAGNDALLTLNSVGNTNGVKVDSKPPQVILSINGGAAFTNSPNVTLTLQTTDTDLSMMQFSNDNTTWSGEIPFDSSEPWILPTGDGTKTVYVRVKDVAGNSTQVSAGITLDMKAPIVTGVTNGGLYNNSRTITFDEGTATLNSITFTSGNTVAQDGTYTLVVTDEAGNVTTVQFEIDKTAPVVTGVENGEFYNTDRVITFNEGNATLNGASFASGATVSSEGTYVLIVTDAAGNATTVTFVIDKTAPIVTGVENGKTYNTDRRITFNEGNGLLNGAPFATGDTLRMDGTYVLVVTDLAGNSTTVGFKIDKTPPAIPVNFVAVGQDTKISLVWTANTESDFEKYLLYVKPEGAAKTLLATIPKGTNNYIHTGLPNGTAYDFFLIAVDQVGNQSAEAPASAKTMGEQTINFAALTDLIYGQQGVALTASATSNLPVSFTSSDPAVAEVYQDSNDGGKWKVNAKKVGTVTITATQAGNNEYLPAAAVGNSLTVVPALLTVTADAKTKVYGEADPGLTYTVKASDLRNGDAASVVRGTLTRVTGESVGSYYINNVDLTASNYNISYEKAKLTITQASLMVTADAKTKVYGEADPALTYTVKASDLRNGDVASVVTGTLTRVMGESVGSYDINNVDLTADNYNISYEKAKLTITQASLTVTADAKTKVYGEADPALTYTVKASDLRNGDAASVVTGTLTRVMGESVGSYDINNVDLTASNYNISYEKAKLTITKALLTVTADAKTKVYGEADPALTYTVKASDLRKGDAASVVTGKVSRIVGEDVGSYAIGQGDLSAGENYNIKYIGANLTITKATLAGLKFVNKEVVYDGTVKSIQLDGKLPAGVTVQYENNDKINAGSYEVKAIIAETQNYFGASFSATLLIRKAKQTINLVAPELLGRDAGKVELDVQVSSGLPVTLSVDDPMVATVSGTDLNVLRLGTVRITATQAGNDNYEAATPVMVSVRVANDASAKVPIRVHQALSPNGDGINEFLIIEGIRDYADNKVTIFDKNGAVLAEIEGYDNRGRVFFGNDHRDGTYFYYIDVKDNGVWKREKGYFVIRR